MNGMGKESQNVEYKETWRDECLKWICGFANADGGVLHIGRDDKGMVVGLANAAKLLHDIPNKVRDILGIMVKVNLREEAGKEYLEIAAEPYPCPVSYRGEYHYRSGKHQTGTQGRCAGPISAEEARPPLGWRTCSSRKDRGLGQSGSCLFSQKGIEQQEALRGNTGGAAFGAVGEITSS